MSAAHAQQVLVGPPDEAACQFHSIQDAIDTANQTHQFNLIAVSANWRATNNVLTVNNNAALEIEGGYDCSSGARNGQSQISALNAPANSTVITHNGTAKLTLSHLIISDGSNSGVISSTPAALVLRDVDLQGNTGTFGGGLSAVGTFNIQSKPVTLLGVRFFNNRASGNGGGLHAVYSDVDIESGFQSENYFFLNSALGTLTGTGDGGAIWALDSDITINTHSTSVVPFMSTNTAARGGGAMYLLHVLDGGEIYTIKNDDPTRPIRITGNTASLGGAIYLQTQPSVLGEFNASSLDMVNTIIDNNTATLGEAILSGAVGISDAMNPSFAQNQITMNQSLLGDSVPACIASLACNSISANHGGSTAVALNTGTNGFSFFNMAHGYLRNNHGTQLILGAATVSIDSSVLTGNQTNTLVEVESPTSDLSVTNSTIANNLDGSTMFYAGQARHLNVLHNIVFQPTSPTYFGSAATTVNVHDLLVGNLINLPPNPAALNIQLTQSPGFVNAAQGDFHLINSSPAIDRWASNGDSTPTFDLDGAPRPFSATGNTATPFDFGAYEFAAKPERVFLDSFDVR